MSWLVVTERTTTTETLQAIVEDSGIAFQYCTDGLTTYEALDYHSGLHLVAEGKSQTYSVDSVDSVDSVEGGNADLRHYLARLAKKSRCFSRCMDALKRNLALFIQCWNRRQLHKHAYPAYNLPLPDFVSIWL